MAATRITKATLVAELEAAHAEIARLEALLEKPAPAASRPTGVKPIVTYFTKRDGSRWCKERVGNDARIYAVT